MIFMETDEAEIKPMCALPESRGWLESRQKAARQMDR